MRPSLSAAVALLVTAAIVSAPAGAREPTSRLEPPPQLAASSVPPGWPEPPTATATSYLLIDGATGQVLAEREADLRRPVASTVKVLTALTVLRRASADEVVTVGREIDGIGGAGIGLRVGDQLTVAQLLDGLIARSGNDAAVTLATYVGGSVAGFVALMRTEAADLGLEGVTIRTPSGLEDDNLLSARDLAVITRAALALPAFRAVAGTPAVTLPRVGSLASRNELLARYPGATGVKTGYTSLAGYSLIGSATRDGRELIVVVLDTPSSDARFVDAAALFDFGFGAFVPARVDLHARLRVAGGWVPTRTQLPAVLVPAGSPDVAVLVALPVEPGATGNVTVSWVGTPLASASLESASDARGPDRPVGDEAVGRWLWDRAYAAMRGATP